MTRSSWRLIPLLEAPGAVQMALDEWLLDQHLYHDHPPTLRFYTWNPPAISLGVSQRRHIPDHWAGLTWEGQPLQIVQRPTGGRGVLHQGDLTYALITSNLPGRREQVYWTLCQFLIEGWRRLGVELGFGMPSRSYGRTHHCFGLATAADLVTPEGRKFIGSAQLKRGQGILQHGSMPLQPDPQLFQQVFQTPAPPAWPGCERLSLAQIVDQLSQAAADCFACEFKVQPLTAVEWQRVQARTSLKNGSMLEAIEPLNPQGSTPGNS